MKSLALTLLLMAVSATVWAGTFDDRGVWHAINGVSLAASKAQSFGTIDVSDRERELAVMVYGKTGDDSLNIKVELFGMMSPNTGDTLKSVTVYSGTVLSVGGAVVIADTLTGNQQVPYLYGRLTNMDADSTATFDAWLYMRPRELLFMGEN